MKKSKRKLLDPLLVRATFRYEPTTGALYYRNAPKHRDIAVRVGTINRGRRSLKIQGRTWSTSWIVWAYCKGKTPKEELDHINMQPWDDRIENLREATRAQNCTNRIRATNSLGYRGVKKNNKRFMACLVKNQVSYYFGTYDTPELAAKAYDVGARKLFGEFAILNFPDTVKRDWLYVASY